MNQLKVNYQESIVLLHRQKWSLRKIARELGLDRVTVRKYVALAAKSPSPQTGSPEENPSKSATDSTVPTGFLASPDSNSPLPHTGSIEVSPSKSPTETNPHTGSGELPNSKSPTHPQTGSRTDSGPESLCEPWREQIIRAVNELVSVQRIYQDLVLEHQFSGSYYSVRRFVLRLGIGQPLPFRRMECEPGEQAQVDFGQGGWVVNELGKRKRPHLFRIVLSYSRKAYSEVVWRQTTEAFIRCLENSFRHFGGVPRTLVLDYVARNISRIIYSGTP